MKKEGFFSERIRPVLVMAVMTIVCISVVSGIHLSTRELVIANEGLFLKKAVLYSAGIELPETNSGINDLYERRVVETDGLFEIRGEDGSTSAWAFTINGPGLWGEIEAVTAFSPDFTRFAGVEFTKQNETPGLGARITESWFKDQLRGRTYPLSMNPEGTGAAAPGEIDALTGATRTSSYVLQLFNRAGEKAAALGREVN